MTPSRLDILVQYYKDEPNDPFNAYALALEYQKSDPPKAKEYFDLLLAKHEEYIPVYYHAAGYYQQINDRQRATAIYEKGIRMARKANDNKALRELQAALDELMF